MVVRRLLSKCHAYDDALSATWLPRLCAYASSSRYLAAATEDLLACPALTPADAAEAAVAAAAVAELDAAAASGRSSDSAAAATAAPRVLRGALHAGSTALNVGHTAVASLGGLVAAALPRIGAAAAALAAPLSAHADAATAAGAAVAAASAADATAAAAAAASVPPPLELLAGELRELQAAAAACSGEAARAIAEDVVAHLSGARAALRGGSSRADVAAALAPAVDAVRKGLPRLAAALDRGGFQAALRRVGGIVDEAVNTELRDAAASTGSSDARETLLSVCEVRLQHLCHTHGCVSLGTIVQPHCCDQSTRRDPLPRITRATHLCSFLLAVFRPR